MAHLHTHEVKDDIHGSGSVMLWDCRFPSGIGKYVRNDGKVAGAKCRLVLDETLSVTADAQVFRFVKK